jgi:UDP-N-acetylglucosamine 1-carboxyvinyltransferase
MDRIRIVGGSELNGTIAISGAKNAALPMVNHVYHLDRSFERLEEKLSVCGASIQRISD